MTHPLDGCWAKIERAKKHVGELELLVEGFKRENSQRVVFKYDSELEKHIAQVRVPNQPPLAWSVIVGDVVHNLRSALDHMAYQLELVAGRTPDRWTGFPIHWVESKFQDAVKGGVPNRFPKDAWRVIEQFQPYRNGDRYPSHGLYRLHELNRRDKHQLLTLTHTVLPFPTLTVVEERADGTVNVIESLAVPVDAPRFEPGTQRFILDIALKESNVYVYGKLGFEVGLDEPDLKYRGPVFVFLNELVHFTENIIEVVVAAVPSLKH